MNPRRRMMMVAAIAVGIAFAAQPASIGADRAKETVQRRDPWVPGTNMIMSAHEATDVALAPPR